MDRFGEAFQPPPGERDRAVAIARTVLLNPHAILRAEELAVLARQYLRELGLPQVA